MFFFWTSSFPPKNDATKNNQPAWMTLLVARKPATPGIQTMVAQQTYRSSWDSISSCFGAMGTSVELGNMTFIHYTNFTWKWWTRWKKGDSELGKKPWFLGANCFFFREGYPIIMQMIICCFVWSFSSISFWIELLHLPCDMKDETWNDHLFKFILGLKFFRIWKPLI